MYVYSAHWLGYNAAFLGHCWFFKFYDAPVDMQIWAPLTRSQCRISDTQVTVKAHELLVSLATFMPMIWSIHKVSILYLNNMIRSAKDQSSTYHSCGKNVIPVIVFHITKSSERWIYKLLFSKLNRVMILKNHFFKVLFSWQTMP